MSTFSTAAKKHFEQRQLCALTASHTDMQGINVCVRTYIDDGSSSSSHCDVLSIHNLLLTWSSQLWYLHASHDRQSYPATASKFWAACLASFAFAQCQTGTPDDRIPNEADFWGMQEAHL